LRKAELYIGASAVAIVLSIALVASSVAVGQPRGAVASAAKKCGKKRHHHHKRRCRFAIDPGGPAPVISSSSLVPKAFTTLTASCTGCPVDSQGIHCHDGTIYTIGGVLSPDSGGTTIQLNYKTDPTGALISNASTATTDATGHWSFTFTPGLFYVGGDYMTFAFNGDATRNPSLASLYCIAP
jgi:hypothetical protein